VRLFGLVGYSPLALTELVRSIPVSFRAGLVKGSVICTVQKNGVISLLSSGR
jgi:hypothetical protein